MHKTQNGLGSSISGKFWGMYFIEYADLKIALNRLEDPADSSIYLQELRTIISDLQKAISNGMPVRRQGFLRGQDSGQLAA